MEDLIDFLYKDGSGFSKEGFQKHINYICNNTKFFYCQKKMKKKNGEIRLLSVPNKKLKKIQRQIKNYIECFIDKTQYKVPICVHGLSGGKTFITNAKTHKNSKIFLCLDIKNFFDVIHYTRVKKTLKTIGMSDTNASFITQLCTFNYCIPQGVPTSSLLSSLSFFVIDKRIEKYCRSCSLIYTRYADDLTISGVFDGDSVKKKIESIILKSGYKINKNKTEIFKKINLNLQQKEIYITGIRIDREKLETKYDKGNIKHDYFLNRKGLNL